jgi:hypothetical protein
LVELEDVLFVLSEHPLHVAVFRGLTLYPEAVLFLLGDFLVDGDFELEFSFDHFSH